MQGLLPIYLAGILDQHCFFVLAKRLPALPKTITACVIVKWCVGRAVILLEDSPVNLQIHHSPVNGFSCQLEPRNCLIFNGQIGCLAD